MVPTYLNLFKHFYTSYGTHIFSVKLYFIFFNTYTLTFSPLNRIPTGLMMIPHGSRMLYLLIYLINISLILFLKKNLLFNKIT